MVKLVLAAVAVILVAAIVFLALDAVLLGEDFAGSVYEKGIPLALAGFVLAALPYVHQIMSGRRNRFSFTGLPQRIVPIESYLLPWYILLGYGVFYVCAASGLGILLVWLLGEITGFYFTTTVRFLNPILISLAFFLVGSWIGKRYEQRPFLTTVGIVAAYSLLSTALALILGGAFRLVPFSLGILLYLVVALFGLWRGRKARTVSYLQYLLSFLPPSMHLEIADRMVEEVQNLTNDLPDEEDERELEEEISF